MSQSQTTPPPLQPPSQAPTAKEKKYDRQLRLWAASGQAALENARVLLLNSGPGVVGIETLKNLILPGIGSFTIVDEAVVEDRDLGINFFLEESSKGKSRAKECAAFLSELNPEVKGEGIEKTIDGYISGSEFLTHTIVLLNGPSPCVHTISNLCWEHSIPLFYLHSLGFYSHFSIQLPPQFPIVDTHPDPASMQDLRLLSPWPALVQYTEIATKNIDTLPDHEHGHIPWLILLLYFLENWKKDNDGKPPQNYDEKKQFKTLVEAGARRSNPEGGEENFDEGAAAVLRSLNPPSISSGLREVFEADSCNSPEAASANFWIVANAIKAFHSGHGVLPLPGAVPDMKAQSSDYIQLQNIYKSKARADVAEVTNTVRSIESSLKRGVPIEDKEIEAFCKGAAFVKLVSGKPVRFAQLASPSKAKSLKDMEWAEATISGLTLELHMQEESLLPVYLAFLAYDEFCVRNSSASGSSSPSSKLVDEASESVNAAITGLATGAGMSDLDTSALQQRAKDVLLEFERADGSELHNIAALTGGMVAQEVIKAVTKQYVPVDNACVFDGIVSKSAVFKV